MAQYNVLKFNISVNNIIFVHVTHSLQDLSCNDGSRFFWERFVLFKQLKQMPIFSQFKQQVNIGFIIEKVV